MEMILALDLNEPSHQKLYAKLCRDRIILHLAITSPEFQTRFALFTCWVSEQTRLGQEIEALADTIKILEKRFSAIHTALMYPPALVLTRDDVEYQPFDSLEHFLITYTGRLTYHMYNHPNDGFFLAQGIDNKVDFEIMAHHFYWIRKLEPNNPDTDVDWISWDYQRYQNSIHLFTYPEKPHSLGAP